MGNSGALSGVRVLELGGYSAAFCGRLLADAGADVVRIADTRFQQVSNEAPWFGGSTQSIQGAWYNAGKRIQQLALNSDDELAMLKLLVAEADLLIEDWAPGTSPVTNAELASLNPSLTHVSLTPFGATGPRARWKTNDLIANAMSGSASVTGDAASGPINGYGNQTHHTVGLYGAVCALAAMRAARSSGQYQHVDLSAHEALVSCTEQVLMQWFFPQGNWGTPIAKRQGSLHWSTAYEVYPGSDGHGVMVTAALRFADALLPWLVEEGAAQELADPEKYPNVLAMVRDLPNVMKVLREWVATHPGEDLFLEGQKRHQPFGVVWNIEEALTRSPQIGARNYLNPVSVPGFGEVAFPGRLFRTDVDGAPPELPQAVERVVWDARPRPDRPSAAALSARPLEGIRILDFTHVLAGPFGTRVLGDLGADVIKVGTAARSAGANTSEHPYYTMWNRNKRSVTINMASAGGRDFARRLAGECDVIIENFSAGVLHRWGLDREGLKDENPGITVISMGGMGQDGPWKDFVTFAPTIHALTGLTYLTNPPGEHLLGYGFSLTDHLSGLAGALAALEGVAHRDRTGSGISVDLSQYELGLGLMGPALIDYLANGTNPEPVGNRHPFGEWAPHGIYPTAGEDRWIAIAIRGAQDWRTFADIAGLDGDARFATHELRIANQDALDAAISGWTATAESHGLAERLQAAGIVAGPVQNARDLAERDPQLAARQFFGIATTVFWGDYGVDQFPALFNGARPEKYEGVHDTGQDTFDVATRVLGLSEEATAELMGSGALT